MKPLADYEAREEGARGAEVKLSQGRKWFSLFIFSVAQVSLHDLLCRTGIGIGFEERLNSDSVVSRCGLLFRSIRIHRCHPQRP